MKLLLPLLLTLLPFSALPAAGHQRQHLSFTADSADCRHVQTDDTISASVITAEYLRHKGRDIIISMKGNPMAEGRDAMAFLNLTPNVRGLRINGKSTYAAIYVNGRKMNLPPDKMAEYLSHLPAENLEYIRIAPGRTIKGGSQEAGGAIFLRLRTGDGGLTNGSAGISADMYTSGPGAEASVPLTLLHSGKKLSSYTFFNGSWSLQPEFQDTENTLEGEWQEYAATGIERAVLMLDHSMTYTISDKHELGFGANLFYKPLEDEHSIFLGQDYVLDKSAGGQHWEELFANYDFTFGDGMNTLSLKADFMNKGDRREESSTGPGADEVTGFTGSSMTGAAQAALSMAVTDWMEVYAGLEHLTLKSRYGYPVLQNGISCFRYKESTTGAYADIYISLFGGSVDLEAGIRYEHSVVHAGGTGPSVENTVGRTYDDWLPAADITYNFKKSGYFMSLSYEKYITRPVMYSFQPFVYSESGKVRNTGNASLLPSVSHEISLTQILGSRHSVGISCLWNRDLEYEQITADKTGILLAPASSAKGHAFSAFANTWFWIWKDRLMFNAGINAEYASYSGAGLQKVRSVNMDGRGSLQWHAGRGWKVSVSGFYLSPLRTLTYRQSSFWGLDLNVTKKFRDRWSLTFGLGNLLHSRRFSVDYRQSGINFRTTNYKHPRTAGISLSYKFGNTKLQRKYTGGITEVKLRNAGK